MAYYLQMDGVDDTLSTPSMTFTQVVIDGSVIKDGNIRRFWGLPFGAEFLQWSGSVDEFSSGVTVSVNDVSKTSGTNFIPNDTRSTVKIVAGTAKTNTTFIFNNNGSSCFAGKIYDVKFYNGATLQAHYDMTLGNVTDQSGNGRNATLTGGTWVNDGAGGTDASVAAVVASATNSAVAPTVTAQQNASITSVVANSVATALAPSVGTPALISAMVAGAAAAGIVPIVNVVRNIEIIGSIASALASAGVPRIPKIGWSPITSPSTTWRESTVAPTIWR